ncbi:MAG TPA: hypothetical protein PLQ76_08860, partial [bacterium]|nr:hypothetical protein [bacterium]
MKEENGKKKTSAENPKRDYFWVIIVAGIIVTIAGSYFLGKFIAKQFIGAKSRVQEVQEGARSNELPIGEMPEDTGDSRDQRKRTTGGSQSESQAQIVTETSDAGASTGTEIQIEKTGDDNGVEQTGPA